MGFAGGGKHPKRTPQKYKRAPKLFDENKVILGPLMHLSGRNESGANKKNESEKAFLKTKEYIWCQNKDYVGGATY